MVVVIGIILVLAVLYFVLSGSKSGKPQGQGVRPPSLKKPVKRSDAAASVALFNEHKAWLATRWAEANRLRDAGDLKTFSSWYFDEATERQLNKLTEKGLSLSGGQVSKGQASDVLGIFFPVEDADEEVLKFFKVPAKGLNQTTARAEVSKLRSDPEKAAAWAQRPAGPMQKEFYRFFGLKVPTGLTSAAADEFIGTHQKALESQQLDDWGSYQSIFDALSDKETCEDYNIKKPSVATVRTAIDALRQSGKSLSDLEDDFEAVVQKLIELKPELERM